MGKLRETQQKTWNADMHNIGIMFTIAYYEDRHWILHIIPHT